MLLLRHIHRGAVTAAAGARGCHSTVTMSGSSMDANTVFHLDKYSRSVADTKLTFASFLNTN